MMQKTNAGFASLLENAISPKKKSSERNTEGSYV
jgi:hypothetical protein